MKNISYWLILLILNAIMMPVFSQHWHFKMDGSIGAFHSSSSRENAKNYSMLDLSGQLKYFQKIKYDQFKFQVKLNPHIFAGSSSFLKETITFRSSYHKRLQQSSIIAAVYHSRQIFDLENVKNLYDNTNAQLIYISPLKKQLKLIAIAMTTYITGDNNRPFKLNIPAISILTNYHFSRYLNIKTGAVFENLFHRFDTEIMVEGLPEKTKRSYEEYKTGIKFELNYIANYIVRISYDVYRIFPREVNEPYFEQGISGLLSFNLGRRWDAMVFSAFYFKHIDDEKILLTQYLPMNSENKIHLKVSYHLSKSLAVFINSGYFEERLVDGPHNFSGMQISLGCEIRN